jgi:CubicO group peptidase (beta-lactamase class C family)
LPAIDKLEIQRKVDSLRVHYNIPAVACAAASSDSVLFQYVTGFRNNQTKEKIHSADKFHIGSLGKAVTAFVAGKLVEDGSLSWDTKFFDLFPEIRENTHPGYEKTTLQDLLSHRARLIPFKGGKQWKIIEDFENSLGKGVSDEKIMIAFARYLLTLEPVVLGEHESIRYSNVGYQLAGLMIERVSHKKWARWVNELNRDLDIRFYVGWPVDVSKEQPIGHLIPEEQGFEGSEHIPISDEIQEFLAPHLYYTSFAGHISISMPDYIRFVQLHLKGLQGVDNYLNAETYDFILRGLPEYAMGWSNDYYQSKHLHCHMGGFVSFQAHVKLVEEDDLAIIVFMNTGANRSSEGLHKIRFLLQDYFMK